MGIFNFNRGYEPLYTTQRGLLIAVRCLLNLLVFSPLILTGYFVAKLVLGAGTNGLLWLLVTLLIAAFTWLIIQQMKYWMLALKARQNLLWLLLYAFAVSLTCLLPAYLAYNPIAYIMRSLHGSPFIAKLFDGAFMLYVYYRYNFFNHR